MTEHIIDTHAHLYPARYLDFLEEHGMSAELTKLARDMHASDEPEEMAARIQQMDEAGVQEQILSVTPQAPMLQDANAALEGARMVNDIYIEQMKNTLAVFALILPCPFLM